VIVVTKEVTFCDIYDNGKSSGEPLLLGFRTLTRVRRAKYCILPVKRKNDDDDDL